MKRAVAAVLLIFLGCDSEPEERMMSDAESIRLQHDIWEFQIYPGAEYLEANTKAYERAHFLMNPGDDEPPRMAFYHSEDSIEEVGAFYAEKYGYGEVAPNQVNDFKPFPPQAYFDQGDLRQATEQIVPMLEQLELSTDISDVEGEFRTAHIEGIDRYPRVTLQRPWYDVVTGEVRDTTMILMVVEE